MKSLLKRIFAFVLVFALAITMVACGEEPAKEPKEFTLEWDLDGGSSSSSMQVSFKEGETVELPTLKKDGYTFVGWTENGELVTTVTEANHKFVAKFEVIKYIVTLNLDGGTCDKTKVEFEYGKALEAALPTPTKEGYEFLGWYNGETKVVKLLENKNYELTAKWELIQNYSNVSFDLDDGLFDDTTTIPVSYLEGTELELPVPTKRGYEFLGWYIGETKYEKIPATATGDLDFVAKWNKVDVISQIFFDLRGGELAPMEGLVTGEVSILSYKEGVELTLPIPTKANAEFVGWYDEMGVFYTVISADQIGELVLTAQWREFYASIGEQKFDSLNKALEAAKDGDTIVLDSCEINDTIDINKSVTIVGKYKDVNRKLDYEIKDDESCIMTQITIGADNVVLNGIRFNGQGCIGISGGKNLTVISCYFDASEGSYPKGADNNRQGIIADIVSGANGVTVKQSYLKSKGGSNGISNCYMTFTNVTDLSIEDCYITNDATSLNASYESLNIYTMNGTLNIKNNIFEYAQGGYNFIIGRYGNNCSEINIVGNSFDGKDNSVTGAFKISKISNKCTVNFIGNVFNNIVTDKTMIISTGSNGKYNFEYNYFNEKLTVDFGSGSSVYYNNNCYNDGSDHDSTTEKTFATKAEVEAAYDAFVNAPKYTVTFDTDGGNEISPIEFTDFNKVTLPTPVKGVSVFLGWYEGETLVTAITENKEYNLKAHWDEKTAYTLTFNTDGGNTIEPIVYADFATVNLPTPTKSGYDFAGWYNGDVLVTALTENVNLELVAHWTEHIFAQLEVGEGKTYTTIASALAASNDGDIIVVYPGTYSEAVVINKPVTIKGPNATVEGRVTTSSGAIFNGGINISVAGVTIDGIDLDGSVDAIVLEADDVTLKHIYSTATGKSSKTDGSSVFATSYYPTIFAGKATSGITIADSTFKTGSVIGATVLMVNGKASDLTVDNTYFESTANGAAGAAIFTTRVGNAINVTNNEFNWASDTTIVLASTTTRSNNSASAINIISNKFNGATGIEETPCKGRIYIQSIDTKIAIAIKDNEFNNMGTSGLFDFRNSKSNATVELQYNYFDENTKLYILYKAVVDTGNLSYAFSNNACLGGVEEGNTFAANANNAEYTTKELVHAAYLASLN